MAAFTFHCPDTGLIVEDWIPDDPTGDKADTYECVICTACMGAHWVNPKTGKVLGARQGEENRAACVETADPDN
jgi:hypothetical protein